MSISTEIYKILKSNTDMMYVNDIRLALVESNFIIKNKNPGKGIKEAALRLAKEYDEIAFINVDGYQFYYDMNYIALKEEVKHSEQETNTFTFEYDEEDDAEYEEALNAEEVGTYAIDNYIFANTDDIDISVEELLNDEVYEENYKIEAFEGSNYLLENFSKELNDYDTAKRHLEDDIRTTLSGRIHYIFQLDKAYTITELVDTIIEKFDKPYNKTYREFKKLVSATIHAYKNIYKIVSKRILVCGKPKLKYVLEKNLHLLDGYEEIKINAEIVCDILADGNEYNIVTLKKIIPFDFNVEVVLTSLYKKGIIKRRKPNGSMFLYSNYNSNIFSKSVELLF